MGIIKPLTILMFVTGGILGFVISQVYFPTVEEKIKNTHSKEIQEVCRNPVIITETTTPDIYYEPIYITDSKNEIELNACIKDVENLYGKVQGLENEVRAWELSYNDLKNKCQ